MPFRPPCRSRRRVNPACTMSMNIFLGGCGTDGNCGSRFQRLPHLPETRRIAGARPRQNLRLPRCARTALIWEILAPAWPVIPTPPPATASFDLPGFYHLAGGFSFADGHPELRRWRDPRTTPPLVEGGLVPDMFDSPNNPDVAWLQDRASRPKVAAAPARAPPPTPAPKELAPPPAPP